MSHWKSALGVFITAASLVLLLAKLFAIFTMPTPVLAGMAVDCRDAVMMADSIICADRELAALDRRLVRTYAMAASLVNATVDRPGPTPTAEALLSFRADWLEDRNQCGISANVHNCLKKLYVDRIAELQAQWILMPAGDSVTYICTGTGNLDTLITISSFGTDPRSIRFQYAGEQIVALQVRKDNPAIFLARNGTRVTIGEDEIFLELRRGEKSICTKNHD